MQSTIALFKKMYEELPPFFPAEVKRKMNHALTHLEKDNSLSVTEIEDTMIIFGYEAWPWQRAYREFFVLAEAKVGEHFLLAKLTQSARRRYEEFKNYGGTLRDLHLGQPINFFSDDDKENFRHALISIQADLHDYTNRGIIGVEKDKYLNRVNEFIKVLESMKQTLLSLKKLADDEQDHPSLAEEIRERVRAFEYGLCFLGPEPKHEAVNILHDHFKGRREELNRLRGINLAEEFIWD